MNELVVLDFLLSLLARTRNPRFLLIRGVQSAEFVLQVDLIVLVGLGVHAAALLRHLESIRGWQIKNRIRHFGKFEFFFGRHSFNYWKKWFYKSEKNTLWNWLNKIFWTDSPNLINNNKRQVQGIKLNFWTFKISFWSIFTSNGEYIFKKGQTEVGTKSFFFQTQQKWCHFLFQEEN